MLYDAKTCFALSQYVQFDMEKSITLLASIICLAFFWPSYLIISCFFLGAAGFYEATGGLALGVGAVGLGGLLG